MMYEHMSMVGNPDNVITEFIPVIKSANNNCSSFPANGVIAILSDLVNARQ